MHLLIASRHNGSLIFQQDGAPPQFSRHVRGFLNQHYQGWIGRAGTIAWPPRSPRLTPLDFYLWSHIKSIVYSEEIASCEQLKEKIIVVLHTLKQSITLESVQSARRTERKFRVDLLENKPSNEKFLFYIFAFFFRVESPPFRLYHQLPTTLYNYSNINSKCKFSVPIPLFRLLRFKILNKYILLRSKKKPNSRFLIKVSKV